MLEGIMNAGQAKATTGTEVLKPKLPTQVAGTGSIPAGQQPVKPSTSEIKSTDLRTNGNPPQGTTGGTGKGEILVRTITLVKVGSGGWDIKFDGPIRQRDINQLIPKLRFAFRRIKRNKSLNRLKLERKDQTNG